MLNSRKHWRVLLAVLAAFAMIVAACGGDDDDSSSATSGGGSSTTAGSKVDYSSLSGTLNGSGSTLPSRVSTKPAIAGFAEVAPERDGELRRGRFRQGQAGPRRRRRRLRRHRQPGEARGHAEVRRPVAASSTSRRWPRRSRCRTTSRASTSCKLDADTLAKIFSRQITKWNDSAIAATNSGVDLPSTAIVVAHRSDAFGHDEQLHQVPHDCGADHVDARQR